MGFDRFIINTYPDLDSRVRNIVQRVYPGITQPDILPINNSLAQLGSYVNNYESEDIKSKTKIVWGTTRMGSKRIVDI